MEQYIHIAYYRADIIVYNFFRNDDIVYVGSTWTAVEESETVVRKEKKGKGYGMSALALIKACTCGK